ncbi:MAG: TolC family protein [Candidatus Sumerlaeia bacterium]|nr:TolC family protein [Candidatus Sumerlaeia bacterium]
MPDRNLEEFEKRTLNDPELKSFLISNKDVEEWPPKAWNLSLLTVAAFYFHPDLDEARASHAVAKAGLLTARQRPNPTVSVSPQFNSTTPESAGVSPWVLAFDFDIPIETAGKRGYRIRESQHLSEAARLKIGAVAWQVRSRVRRSLLDLYAAGETESLLRSQLAILEDNARLMKLQLEAGAVSPFEVSQANIALAATRLAVDDAVRKRAEARAALASSLGLPVKALDGVNLSFEELQKEPAEIPPLAVRREALLNRADLLSALAEYEAAQAALQIEIAKQYPDIHLGPGYEYDQSEHKWGIALSLELPVLNQNKGPIAEAEAKRAEAAAKFNALQARVLGEIELAAAGYERALQKVQTAKELVSNSTTREQAALAMFKAGEISKLELATIQIERKTNELALLSARIEVQLALGALEDAMQRPTDGFDWRSRVPYNGKIPEVNEERPNNP